MFSPCYPLELERWASHKVLYINYQMTFAEGLYFRAFQLAKLKYYSILQS